MTYDITPFGYIIRIHANEKLTQTLAAFAKEQEITGAFFYGLGALRWTRIGIYRMDTFEYTFQEFDEPHEITNVSGNITRHDGSPLIHAHMTIADSEQNAFGGHCDEAIIEPTCELTCFTGTTPLERTHDDRSDLPLLDLPQSFQA